MSPSYENISCINILIICLLFYSVLVFWNSITQWLDFELTDTQISSYLLLFICLFAQLSEKIFWLYIPKFLLNFFLLILSQRSHCQTVIVLICFLYSLKKVAFCSFAMKNIFSCLSKDISYICSKFSSPFTVLSSSEFLLCLFWSWFSLLEAYFWCLGSDYRGADWSLFGRGEAGLVSYDVAGWGSRGSWENPTRRM